MNRLEGKVVIVSGSSSGLGFAEAKLMASEGAKVVMFARGEERLLEKAEEIRAAGGDVLAMRADATSAADWDMVVAKTVERYGKIDVLVNNAGQAAPNYPSEQTTFTEAFKQEAWEDHINELFMSQVLGAHACLPELRKTKGNIIFNSSMTVLRTSVPVSAYGCAKAAVRCFAKSLADQLGPEGIRVNIIIPGYIHTNLIPFSRNTEIPVVQSWMKETALGYLGEPEDIAYAVCYLASDEAKYVTGTEIVVDGGFQL